MQIVDPEKLPGQTIAQRYLVETLLGQGGMGAVFRARHLETRQPVALKVVLPAPSRLRLVSRFMREARLSARLHHPHVVRVHDFGRWGAQREHGYLAMDLVEGTSLERLLDADLPLGTIADLVRQILAALAHVHARGVLHRDIKPDNVLISRRADGALFARVTDFGLAYALNHDDDDDGTRLTQDGTILGTPAYIAPEQASGQAGLGPATDLYAVGVLLYRMLSGRLPYTGDAMQMLLARLHRPPAPLTPRAGLELPPLLVALVEKLLARQPEDRFGLAADVLAELAPFAQPEPLRHEVWLALVGHESTEAEATLIDDGESRVTLLGLEPGPTASAILEALWGRDAELAELEALATRAELGEGQLVLLTGELGVGKTALAERFVVGLNEAGRFRVLRAQGSAATGLGSAAQCALRAALDQLLDVQGRPAAVAERAVRALLSQHGDDDESEVGDLMAVLRPEAVAAEHRLDMRQSLAVFVRMLRRLARSRPVVALIDDLEHDAALAALIELLIFELTLDPFPVLVLVPLRPLRPLRPGEQAVRGALARTVRAEGRVRRVLELGPLDEDVLALGLERRLRLSPHVARHVARRCGGNPLFAHHLAQSASAAGSTLDTRTLHTFSSTSASLPEVLRAILEQGLNESLERTPEPARARALLEQIAVLGEQVELDLLEALLEPDERRSLDDDLDALIDVGLVREVGRDVVAVANALLAPIIVGGLGPRRLRRMHERAAAVRRERAAGAPAELGPIGDHLAAAGHAAEAVEAWLAAHAHAEAHGLAEESARWGHKVLSGLAPDDERAAPCALVVARTLRSEADLDGAFALLEPLVGAADPDIALQAAELLAEILQERADFDRWDVQIAALDERFAEAGPRGRAAALRARAFWHNLHRRFSQARACIEEALALGGSDDPVSSVAALTRLVWSSISLGALDDAQTFTARAFELAGSRLDLHAEALRLEMLVHAHAGRVESMLEVGTRMLEMQRRTGRVARSVSGAVDLAMGCMMNERGDLIGAWLEQASTIAERFGLTMELVRCRLIAIGGALLEADGERALSILAEPVVQGPLARDIPLFRMARAWAMALVGRVEEARADLGRFDIEAQPASRLVAWGYAGLGLVFESHGEHALAERLLTGSRDRWQRLGDTEKAARVEALLARA